jgi:molybdenum cofactor cytidylyltransferase
MSVRFSAIILGAGASSRMGQPKLLLPWEGSTIIGHLLSLWHSHGADQLAVVCAPRPHPLHSELDRLDFGSDARIVNPFPERGMFSSVQAAARWQNWKPELTHFAVVLGDQPHIRAETLCVLLKAVTSTPDVILQPIFAGRAKHPVILPRAAFMKLADTSCQTLRDFLRDCGFPRGVAEIGDESLALDIDTPEEYRLALRKFSSGSPFSSEQT